MFASPLSQIFFPSETKTKMHCNQQGLPWHLLLFIRGNITEYFLIFQRDYCQTFYIIMLALKITYDSVIDAIFR